MFVNKKCLGQYICKHILCITMYQLDKTIYTFSLHSMTMNLNMFYVSMKDCVLQSKYTTLVLVIYNNGCHL